MGNFCVAADADVFDYLTGTMVKASDKLDFGMAETVRLCVNKNKGECADFKAIQPAPKVLKETTI